MKLGLVSIHPSTVTVADGRKLRCDHKCHGFKWKMQEYEFQFNVKTLELGEI